MKVLVTGAAGQLGYDVFSALKERGHDVVGSDIQSGASGLDFVYMDITDRDNVQKVFSDVEPEAIIHCGAWTGVDAAESEGNRERVYAINVQGTSILAELCKEYQCKMLYISTDYVFDGKGSKPWEPDCKEFAPMNVYGKTKLLGEVAVCSTLEKYFIVRIAWVFGKNGNNFVKTMLNIGKRCKSISVVNDQIGTPTYTMDIAQLLVDMIQTDKYGFYHATNQGGYISWYEFACEIFKLAGYQTEVIPVSTKEYGLSKAKRPANSRLDKQKLTEAGFEQLPHWKDALQRYLKSIKVLG